MNQRTFFEGVEGGEVDLYIMDRDNYELYKAGKDFVAGLVKENVASEKEVKLPLPDASKEWVVVVSNARRAAFLQLVQVDLRLVQITPDPGQPEAEPEPGGCDCAVGATESRDLSWVCLAALVAAAWARRRKTPKR